MRTKSFSPSPKVFCVASLEGWLRDESEEPPSVPCLFWPWSLCPWSLCPFESTELDGLVCSVDRCRTLTFDSHADRKPLTQSSLDSASAMSPTWALGLAVRDVRSVVHSRRQLFPVQTLSPLCPVDQISGSPMRSMRYSVL